MKKIAGPSWGHFLRGLQKPPPFFFYELMLQYGDVVKIGPHVYLINHPDIARHIFKRDQKYYDQNDFVSKRARAIFGNGLVVSDGDTWVNQRRLLTPHFRHKGVSSLMPVLIKEMDRILDEWQEYARSERPFDLVKEMGRITIRLAGQTLFRTDLKDQAEKILAVAAIGNRYLSQTTPFYIPFWIPTPAHQKIKRTSRTFRKILDDIVRAHQKEDGPNGHMAATLIHHLGSATASETDRRLLYDELQTMLLGGFFPMTATLSMFWYALSNQPDHLARLQHEIDQQPENNPLAPDFIQDFPMLIQLLYESMRLYPVAFSLWRKALVDDYVQGYKIPKGVAVAISVFNIHRHPGIWKDPDRFDPTRFEKSRLKQLPGHYFIPFGYGVRKCIGDHYSMIAMPLLIIKLLQRYRIELIPQPQLVLQRAQLMIPERVMARIHFKSE